MSTATVAAAPSSVAGATKNIDHLSWSAIRTYTTCSRRYYLKYIAQVPEESRAAALIFGSAFHFALDFAHQQVLEGNVLPPVALLLTKYKAKWNSEAENTPEVTFAKADDEASLIDLATRMLTAYRDYLSAEATVRQSAQIIAIEHAHRFRLLADVPPIECRLDLVQLAGTELILSDVKTSKSRWGSAKTAESILQLVLYANAITPLAKEMGAARIVPRFIVVTKAASPVVQIVDPHATQNDVDRLKQLVSGAWLGIKSGVFFRNESWACSQCPYRCHCLGR